MIRTKRKIAPAATAEMTNEVPGETPTDHIPKKMNNPSPIAQAAEVMPLSMLGGRKCTGGILLGTKKLTEPVTLSSTAPADFRLPPTVARSDFDLLAPRARCKRDSRALSARDQELERRFGRNLRKVQFSTFSTARSSF